MFLFHPQIPAEPSYIPSTGDTTVNRPGTAPALRKLIGQSWHSSSPKEERSQGRAGGWWVFGRDASLEARENFPEELAFKS